MYFLFSRIRFNISVVDDMKKLDVFIGVIFLTVLMAFIIPEVQERVIAQNFTSGAGLVLNNYGVIILVIVVVMIIGALIVEVKD